MNVVDSSAWLSYFAGDKNSAFFHKTVKSRNSRNRIDTIQIVDGSWVDREDDPNQFLTHFQNFLGTPHTTFPIRDPVSLFTNKLSNVQAASMLTPVSDIEIKLALFQMGDDKAPGPDGFTAKFFKSTWDVVGKDVCLAVREFFTSGKLLKSLNSTILALIPKSVAPSRVTDFSPIACCNVLYKCISKINADRLKGHLPLLVNENQSAFIPGRLITDNVLHVQDLMRGYHKQRGPPRCAFKVDIQKAYDTVDWHFLRTTLFGFGFPLTMIDWIMTCVSTASYSVSINGNLHGYFKGGRGLRQGGPSPPTSSPW